MARRTVRSRASHTRRATRRSTGADALRLVTEWNEFREPDFATDAKLMKQPVVFDGRNIYSPAQMRALGFTYFSIGRP